MLTLRRTQKCGEYPEKALSNPHISFKIWNGDKFNLVLTSVVRTTMSVSAISADSGPGKPHIRPDTCPLVQSTHVRSPSVGVYL